MASQQIFLSYAREDLDEVSKLYDGLTKRGLKVWFDKKDLKPGLWKRQIEDAISRSRYFLSCISSNALVKMEDAPGFMGQEFNFGYNFVNTLPESDFTIVPVFLEDCDRDNRLDHRIAGFTYYAMYENWEAHLDNLAFDLGGRRLDDSEAKDMRSDEEKDNSGLIGRAITAQWAGKYKEAIRLWHIVQDRQGETDKTWHNIGNAYRRLERYGEALQAYDNALSINPEAGNTWYNKGRVLRDTGRFLDALNAFERAGSLNTDDVETLKAAQDVRKTLEGLS